MPKQITEASTTLGIKWADYVGKLIVVEPLDVEKDIQTVNGPSDAVVANVYVVRSADGSKYEAYEDCLIFPRGLRRQVKSQIGKIVVGRLSQGAGKPGQNPPWLLAPPSDSDTAAARGLLAALQTSAMVGASESYDDGFEEAPAQGASKSAPADEGEF